MRLKKILITGKDSYIGTMFTKRIMSVCPGEYLVESVSTVDGQWKEADFTGADVVLHLAAVVHKKERPDMSDLYHGVNTKLAVDIAQKAKQSNVGHFIFMSTMAVYGVESGTVTMDTVPIPTTLYGRSKLEAEWRLQAMAGRDFVLSILRPPMVYGAGCPGNYPRLSGLVRKLPFFPKVNGVRSMIYIDFLCEFLRQLIDRKCGGIFFPQNKDYISVTELAALIRKAYGQKELHFSALLGKIVTIVPLGVFRKVFGTLVYDKSLSEGFDYCFCDFAETIKMTSK